MLSHAARTAVFATAVAGLCAQPTRAQSSRAAVIAEEQASKSEELGLEGPDAIEKSIVWVMRSPLLAGTGGAYPWFGSAYQGTGTALGAGFLKRMPRRSRLNLLAGVSVRGSSVLDIRARLPEPGRGWLSVSLGARRTVAKTLSFYGLGPESDDTRLKYDYQPTELGAAATIKPLSWFQLTGGYRWLDLTTSLASAGNTDTPPPGLNEDLTYHVVQATAAIDWRTSPGYSTRGGLYRATWSRYQESRDRPFSFDSLEYEVVQLVPLLREQFVLAVRGLATVTMTDEGERVPFVLTPFLGSGETLRGFVTWRFTDRNRLLLTGEYRWRPSRFMDMAVFLDAGKVAPRSRDLNLSELETNWGFGARFHGPSFTAFRAEVAKSREGWRLILAGRHAF